MESVSTFFSYLLNNLKAIRFTDVLDILLMAFIIYKGVELVRKTHSTRLAKGILFLVLIVPQRLFFFNSFVEFSCF